MAAVDSPQKALEAIQSPSFEPTVSVVLEATKSPVLTHANVDQRLSAPDKHVHLKRKGPNEVLVSVTTQSPGYLVLTDTYYPGWHAYLDGQQVPLYRANYLFKSIFVPPGAHQERFVFAPVSFSVGEILLALSLSAMTAFYALSWIRYRKSNNKQLSDQTTPVK